MNRQNKLPEELELLIAEGEAAINKGDIALFTRVRAQLLHIYLWGESGQSVPLADALEYLDLYDDWKHGQSPISKEFLEGYRRNVVGVGHA